MSEKPALDLPSPVVRATIERGGHDAILRPVTRADENLEAMRADALSDWPLRLATDLGKYDDLSQHDLDVLRCASVGLNRHMTADVLGVCPDTVKKRLRRVRYRLRAKNTTHAVCLAIRGGLIA